MTIPKFKKWLESKIQWIQNFPEPSRNQNDWEDIRDIGEEAYQIALDLHLAEAAEILGKSGPTIIRLQEALKAISKPKDKQVYSLEEAADYLGYSESGLRKIKTKKQIRFAQNGQGPIKFQREWLDEFLEDKRKVERSPAQKRRSPISVENNHGL